jgi:hypothetical protein
VLAGTKGKEEKLKSQMTQMAQMGADSESV